MVLNKVLFIIPVLFFLGCGSNDSSVKNKSEEEVVKIPNGAELYVLHCTSCHGSDGKLGVSGAKDLTKSMLSDQEIKLMIENGKNAMPPMKELLESDENIKAVTEYIKGMRK